MGLPLRSSADIEGLHVEVEVEPVNGSMDCTRLVVARIDESSPAVTGEVLRRIPVRRLVGEATPEFAVIENPPPSFYNDGPTEAVTEHVATVYRWALMTGQPPTGAVQWATGRSRSTAERWIRLARGRGQLEPPTAGQGKGSRGKR